MKLRIFFLEAESSGDTKKAMDLPDHRKTDHKEKLREVREDRRQKPPSPV